MKRNILPGAAFIKQPEAVKPREASALDACKAIVEMVERNGGILYLTKYELIRLHELAKSAISQ